MLTLTVLANIRAFPKSTILFLLPIIQEVLSNLQIKKFGLACQFEDEYLWMHIYICTFDTFYQYIVDIFYAVTLLLVHLTDMPSIYFIMIYMFIRLIQLTDIFYNDTHID